MPDNYYSRLNLDTTKLASLLDEINRINTEDKENDIIGRIYEYFLSKFALSEGKGKGEFYTPKCIVNLIAEMIEPYDGILLTPVVVAVVCSCNLSSLWKHTAKIKIRFLYMDKNIPTLHINLLK